MIMQTSSLIVKKRILLIDDDPDILEILSEYLSEEGVEISTSNSTCNIFQLINTHQPHLIVLDYILSSINGGEICHQIKNSPQTSHIPVVIISAYPMELISLGNYGSDLLIPKPFDLDILRSYLKQLLDTNYSDFSSMQLEIAG
jgi:DNA-binding response OmpR family regulator